MESVLKQFSLYVENGELDPELLAMTYEQLSYADTPSLIEGKYVYVANNAEIQHLLFSDQSGICWISDQLSGHIFAQLIAKHTVALSDLREQHQPILQRLATYRIVTNSGDRVMFSSVAQANSGESREMRMRIGC